jgi:hypothetical protein
MTVSKNKYYSLIASLPRLNKNFNSGVKLPIDKETFFSRLDDLKKEDKNEIEILFSHSQKIHKPMKWSDEDIIKFYEETYNSLKHNFVKELLINGLSIRLALFVLRKKKLGEDIVFPKSSLPIIKNKIKHIATNIDHQDLKLSSEIKYISKISEAMNSNNILEIERAIDENRWELAEKLSVGEFFTFKTLISYFMKWDIINRWSKVDNDTGIIGFEEVLGEVQRYEF